LPGLSITALASAFHCRFWVEVINLFSVQNDQLNYVIE